MYKAINNHIAKRPKKLLISKYSNINGKVLLAVVSKNFAKVPKNIPKHSISILFIIFLVMGISFSILSILFSACSTKILDFTDFAEQLISYIYLQNRVFWI